MTAKTTHPLRLLCDPDTRKRHKWTPSFATDVRETWRRAARRDRLLRRLQGGK